MSSTTLPSCVPYKLSNVMCRDIAYNHKILASVVFWIWFVAYIARRGVRCRIGSCRRESIQSCKSQGGAAPGGFGVAKMEYGFFLVSNNS